MRRNEKLGAVSGALLAWALVALAPGTGAPAEPPRPWGPPAVAVPLPTTEAVAVAVRAPEAVVPVAVDPIAAPDAPRFAQAGAPVGRIEGHVVGADGAPLSGVQVMVRSELGGVHAVNTDAEGDWALQLPPGRVGVAASRWDDLVEVRSDETWVAVEAGRVQTVPLELQAEAGADAGVVAVEHPDGFEVTWAVPGLAAHALGLGPGDRIVAVDGRPATELTAEELERALVGPEGTEVSLTVRSDGGDTEVVVPRWGLDPEALDAASEG